MTMGIAAIQYTTTNTISRKKESPSWAIYSILTNVKVLIMLLNKQQQPVLGLLLISVIFFSCSTPRSVSNMPSMEIPSGFKSSIATQPDNTVSRSKVFGDTNLVRLIDIAVMQNPDVSI